MNAALQPVTAVPPKPRTATRAARVAADRRRARTLRARYTLLARIFYASAAVTIFVCAYVALLDNVTRMDYQIARVAAQRARLIDESSRNADTIARLESRERLATVAAQLGMRDAATFVVVRMPDAPVVAQAPHALAFLSWLIK